MKKYRFVLTALSLLLAGCGQEKSSGSSNHYKDEAEIKGNAKAYEEAYNSRDAEKVSSFWSVNAVYVIPDNGETIQGRSAIGDYFKDLFNNKEPPNIDIVIDKIAFEGSDKAIENGHVKFTYKDGSEDETDYRAEDIKENGKWVLQSVREIETRKAISNYENLKDLNWLVGSWEDTDNNSEIDLNFKWSINKNFLIEKFTVKILDRNEMEGFQVIGWDPILKQVRSWVFDSDGGFREGTWSLEGDKWIASMVATLADGKKGSSVDIYTKIDDNNFSFDMDSRDIDGELLPDIGPVNFKKIK
jgi:uncharacterized protein (TIGR02246 family)